MQPIVHALDARRHVRAVVRGGAAALVIAAVVVAALALRERSRPLYVVITAPASTTVAVTPAVPLDWCRGYDWRYSSIDLRPFCGWR